MSIVRSTAFAVAGGLAAALLFVSLAKGNLGGIILMGMTPLPLFLVGLSLGVMPAAIASMVGAAVILAVDMLYGTVFLADFALPVMIVVPLALWRRRDETKWRPASQLVIGLTVLAAVVFLVSELSLIGQPGGMEGSLRTVIGTLGKELRNQDPQIGDQAEHMLQSAARWLPGVGAAAWIGLIAANGVLAQGALAGFGWARRPAPKVAAIAVPWFALVPLAAAIAAAVLGRGEIAFAGSNLTVILAMPFLFQGLGVIHALAARSSKRAWLLAGVYVAVLIFGWPIPLIVALGVIEQWVGLRRRYAATGREKSDG
ncbi:MAG TPA: DUF2232 domain-containing protein [Aliidongia sp.]|uniref:DUF2232 domain-containing protein n=1 Tax=Aliidongia sp. TaxID=1914230 RepID=UPI002DDD4230|nr:DUF2232 domain-containing protein [Aliidongia sp.]HEV2678642.1 DUF2232 domain-containing protein [Aliidongia sp.]